MALSREAKALVDGEAEGEVLRLDAPLSFWGGVDAETGRITQPRHPNHDQCVSGKILAMERAVGSSSSGAVLLELIYRGKAPAALLLGEPDAILALGVVVAREMGYGTLPVLQCPVADLATGERLRISPGGRLAPARPPSRE